MYYCLHHRYMYYLISMSIHTVRHTGIVLWIQQFMAMFLKRFYNSLRFYHAVITQLILPFIFIILALLIVKIPKGSSQGANPKRTLTLSGGSLSNEAETFWAHFGPLPPTFSFEVSIHSQMCTCTCTFMYIHIIKVYIMSLQNTCTCTCTCTYILILGYVS